MLADKNLYFNPLYSSEGPAIYGVINTAMIAFTAVALDPATEDPKTLIAANGVRGWFIERDVILNDQAGRDRLLREQVFGNELTPPFRVGQPLTAVWYPWVDVEHADYLDASLTGATAADTPVCFKAGKFADQTAVGNENFEVVGYIRRVLTERDGANDGRFEIEMLR